MKTPQFIWRAAERRLNAFLEAERAKAADGARRHRSWIGALGKGRNDLAVVMMAKDQEDVIAASVSWSLFLGFRRFAILDNGSTDGTRRQMEAVRSRWPEAEILVVDDPGLAFDQGRKTFALAGLAERFWPAVRWIFPLDCDEFVCVEDSLDAAVERLDAAESDVFLSPYFDAQDLPEHLGDGSLPFYRRQACLRIRASAFKVFYRAGSAHGIKPGNHDVEPGFRPQRRGSALDAGIVYRHHPVRSLDQLREKIRIGAAAVRATDAHPSINAHWRGWQTRFEQDGEAAVRAIYAERQGSPASIVPTLPIDEALAGPSVVPTARGG